MYSIKEYPKSYKTNKQQWLKYKRKIKKIAHTKMRRREWDRYRYRGKVIDF